MSQNINEKNAMQARNLEQERMRMITFVRGKFAKYGDQVCECMQTAVQHSRGAERVMSKLGIPVKSTFEKQIDSIVKYINSHGSDYFLQRIKPGHKHAANDSLFGETIQTLTKVKDDPEVVEEVESVDEFDGPEFDLNNNYIGPERRQVSERRLSKDRRASVEIIQKNQRFFGERRKEARRKSDREKMFEKE